MGVSGEVGMGVQGCGGDGVWGGWRGWVCGGTVGMGFQGK